MSDGTGLAWICDVCREDCGRMIVKSNGETYVRHLRCEPKTKEDAPSFRLKGLGWARHGYTKDFEG